MTSPHERSEMQGVSQLHPRISLRSCGLRLLATDPAQPRRQPFGLLNLVDGRCGGTFDDIDTVIRPAERAGYMAGYKAAAGFAIETLNAVPPTIGPGGRGEGEGDFVGRISEA